MADPEPLAAESPLFDLPNVFVTPHVAGSHGNEVERLGRGAVDEVARLLAGRPLAHQVHRLRTLTKTRQPEALGLVGLDGDAAIFVERLTVTLFD